MDTSKEDKENPLRQEISPSRMEENQNNNSFNEQSIEPNTLDMVELKPRPTSTRQQPNRLAYFVPGHAIINAMLYEIWQPIFRYKIWLLADSYFCRPVPNNIHFPTQACRWDLGRRIFLNLFNHLTHFHLSNIQLTQLISNMSYIVISTGWLMSNLFCYLIMQYQQRCLLMAFISSFDAMCLKVPPLRLLSRSTLRKCQARASDQIIGVHSEPLFNLCIVYRKSFWSINSKKCVDPF